MTDRFLPTPLRRALEKAVKAARIVAEAGAADAVRRLGVAEAAPPAHLDENAKALRRRLRAHARTLGDAMLSDGTHAVRHLVEATGYAQWHRRLFARFLAERGLLRHPEHGPVSLEDCEELAKLEGFADAWTAAETYGARMLPGVFNPDDPVLALAFAPEHAQALRKLVEDLEPPMFQAEDSLGWTYQFWRAAEKDAVNKSGVKIGADELPAVTQLFTEPYMVRFLLHNTLGAWRAGKLLERRPELAAGAADEDELRAAVALPNYDFDMLRFVKEGEDAPRWRPAAGTYPGWPTEAAKLTVLDPCCGSGHFLTEALTILADLRADEEGLALAEAVVAVLRDNLFGLEIDGRCVQIAAFATALTAWKIGGWQTLPAPHIAWVGAPPPLPKLEFMALANGDVELKEGLDKLWDVFAQAPLLGSLIDPTGGDLMSAQRLGRIEPLLDRLVDRTRGAEPARAEGAVAARGMADAARLLAKSYTLVVTNVPFLGRGKQVVDLKDYILRAEEDSRADLATAILSRTLRLLARNGTTAAVTPQNWLFLSGCRHLRARLVGRAQFNLMVVLGEHGFDSAAAAGAFTALTALTNATANTEDALLGLDATKGPNPAGKRELLSRQLPTMVKLEAIRTAPDNIISIQPRTANLRVGDVAYVRGGTTSGDSAIFRRAFWEIAPGSREWSLENISFDSTRPFNGRSHALLWERGEGLLASRTGGGGSTIAGRDAWGRDGIAISYMRDLSFSLYNGCIYENTICVLVPRDREALSALWSFCVSGEMMRAVRRVNQKLSIDVRYFEKADFDLPHWQQVAAKDYPNGLPEPYSDDPTQWLFHGHPGNAETGTGLHVALARLAGYRWPAESDPDMRLSSEARDWIARAATLPSADNDGLLCLEAVAGEAPLAQRLRAFLAVAFGDDWSAALERRLVTEADQALDKNAARDLSLEAWLRDRAFRQHCRLFHDRPFLWQVWDGSADGFSALVHYHRLNGAALSKLANTLLGDWIGRMEGAGDIRRAEAAKILQPKLRAILDGEADLDIFVRWKPLEKQPFGWDPDLDDGVRLNIRPFIEAGVLRETPKIKWGVDRGKDVASAPWFGIDKGMRNNDHHLSLAEKRAARDKAG